MNPTPTLTTEQIERRKAVCGRCRQNTAGVCARIRRPVAELVANARLYCDEWGEALPATSRSHPSSLIPHRSPQLSVAVVVISHNYGRFLAEAFESVLAQSVRPAEILVVDDSSTDDTADVAAQSAPQGVRYMRTDAGNVHQARKAGFESTRAEILCFLDADDRMPADYLAGGLPAFSDHRVGVVYSDVVRFGDESRVRRTPTVWTNPTRSALFRENFVHAASLVRREALELVDPFATPIDPAEVQDDWFLWQQLALAGWQFRRQESCFFYRRHPANHSAVLLPERLRRGGYFGWAGLRYQPVTLFIPLSGRGWAWQRLNDFLRNQTWPREQIRLILCDTSQNANFSSDVREWIDGCDYPDVRHLQIAVAEPGTADEERRGRPDVQRRVNRAMARIYQRLAQCVETEYVWILEDDILPPVDVCERLLRGFGVDVVSVAAAYRSRFHGSYVAWDQPRLKPIKTPGRGVTEVMGNGFGCVVMRAELLRNNVFTFTQGVRHYDQEFYRRLPANPTHRRLVDWSCECEHLQAQHAA